MQHALSFALMYLIPTSVVIMLVSASAWLAPLPILVAFVAIPLFDHWRDTHNLTSDEENARQAGTWLRALYDFWLYLWIPMECALLLWGIATVVARAQTQTLSPFFFVCSVVALGILSGGGGITIAHELMHRQNSKPAKAGAEILMMLATYTHFCVEHVYGHHKHVSTPHDPATSRLHENVYQFLPRTIVGSIKSAWQIETYRCQTLGIKPYSLRDKRTRYSLALIAVYAAITAIFGGWGTLVFAAQSCVGFLLLEIINYVEHYGLQRKQKSDGSYESVAPRHSWNSSHLLSGRLLFALPRHADHHHRASRPYAILRHIDDSPQMPFGYPTMVLLALVPPLWHRVMDARAIDWNRRVDQQQ